MDLGGIDLISRYEMILRPSQHFSLDLPAVQILEKKTSGTPLHPSAHMVRRRIAKIR